LQHALQDASDLRDLGPVHHPVIDHLPEVPEDLEGVGRR